MRQKWRVAIRRVDKETNKLWNPGKEDIVCHSHFTETDYKDTGSGERSRLKPEAVPSIFDFKTPQQESDRSKRMRLRCARESSDVTDTVHLYDVQEVVVESLPLSSDSQPVEEEPEIEHDDKEVQCEIPVVGPAAFDLNYKCSLLSPQDQLFLTLIKLRQAAEDVELSMLFQVSESTVSKIITTWINFLYFQLKELEDDFWPSMKTIKQHMPIDFSKKFGNTRVILDATEQPIQKPSNVDAQSKTWSSYKHKNTLKTMIGITPNGAVSYISSAYAGSVSDRQIIERSTLLDSNKFSPGESIMTDRGIMTQDLFATQNVYVNTPSLLKGKSQLDPEEIVRDRRVASKRIHVERVIGLAKTFKILNVTLKP
uniref:Uncharacterized protein LOC111107454 n=1 Tax=Crassostrea virginica TaxID=6565 RepID=A0A8B8B5K4_CRAVI|nr:uncharacterized protein LOC111107454 [Crassostrea virginica]